jgi:hypothetical protein
MEKIKKEFKLSIGVSLCIVFLIWLLGPLLDSVKLLPDQGASWYYWKLPTKEFLPRFTAWFFYLLHQVVVWFGIYKLRKEKIKKWNYFLLISNLAFVLVHLLQTHLWYDGLANDVPVFSSQGSVIVMLVMVLIMENDRRGLLFGWKVPGFKDVKSFIRNYHGYFIAWAVIYTFWYHPMVSTSGHLVGFFYLFLLMLQLSFAYTPIHMNQKWTFLLEVLVLFHGTTVAIQQGNNMWPMFGFGFAFLAIATQIYGIGLSKKVRLGIQFLYVVGALIVFSGLTGHREFSEIHQITWIPVVEYGLVFVMLFVLKPVLMLFKKES